MDLGKHFHVLVLLDYSTFMSWSCCDCIGTESRVRLKGTMDLFRTFILVL